MIENKRFQKRYIEENNKVYDTFKEMPITDELNSDSLLNVISHLNGLGEMIDTKIEQGRYCMKKYKELEDKNEQYKRNSISLKQLYKILEENKEHFLSLSECFSEKLFIKTIFRNIDEDIESREEEK